MSSRRSLRSRRAVSPALPALGLPPRLCVFPPHSRSHSLKPPHSIADFFAARLSAARVFARGPDPSGRGPRATPAGGFAARRFACLPEKQGRPPCPARLSGPRGPLRPKSAPKPLTSRAAAGGGHLARLMPLLWAASQPRLRKPALAGREKPVRPKAAPPPWLWPPAGRPAFFALQPAAGRRARETL